MRLFLFTFRLIIVIMLLGFYELKSQDCPEELSKYAVFFKDKNCSDFDPHKYFNPKAIERRERQCLSLFDWYDLPVDETYLREVELIASSIKMHSRWLNATVVMATEKQIHFISRLPCVKYTEKLVSQRFTATMPQTMDTVNFEKLSPEDSSILKKQTERMGSEAFRNSNLNGKGIRIAIFDAGFSGGDKHQAFEYLRSNNKIIKTYDFVDKKDHVWHGSNHGTGVWSCIAGQIGNKLVGLAWDAEFLLARTEKEKTEPFSEEENWVAAAEWADKNGADIINSSLGYTEQRYFPDQMNGISSFISRGASVAARKGMLIINSAGNEGNKTWKIIVAPADADSVLSIGGVESCCDYHISYSSFGPTWDLRLKPNLCAQGSVICAKNQGFSLRDGTSFSSPLVAGFAACAWQSNRNLSNMELFRKLEECGHLHPYFDYAHGYGIPNAQKFLFKTDPSPSFILENENNPSDSLRVIIQNEKGQNSKDGNLDSTFQSNLKIHEKLNPERDQLQNQSDLLYYQIMNNKNLIERYYVIKVQSNNPLSIYQKEFSTGQKIRICYHGYTKEIKY